MGRKVPAPLPKWEQLTYYVVFTCGAAYGIYNLYLSSSSRDLLPQIRWALESGSWLSKFSPGGEDVADELWYMYKGLIWKICPLLLLHILMSIGLQHFIMAPKVRKCCCILFGISAIMYVQSWRIVLLYLVIPIPFYLASTLASVPAVCYIFIAASYLQTNEYMLQMIGFDDFPLAKSMYEFVPLRCTFFALERVWSLKQREFAESKNQTFHQKRSTYSKDGEVTRSTLIQRRKTPQKAKTADTTETVHTTATHRPVTSEASAPSVTRTCVFHWPVLTKVPELLDLYLYAMYLPMLAVGPILNFRAFIEQFENPVTMSKERFYGILWKMLRICFWLFFNNVMKHFLYFAAFSEEKELIQNINKWTLTTTAWLLGQFWTNQFVVMYGTMIELAKFEGLNFAQHPACMSTIYLYSDMWRSFDRGLHACLKRYLFIPISGSKPDFFYMETAAFSCFVSMGCFHQSWNGIIWALINFTEFNLEHLGTYLERTTPISRQMKKLSPAWDRRFRALLSYPLFLVGTTSSLLVLGNRDFAYCYFTRIGMQWDSFVTLGVITFSAIQISKHLEMLGHTKLD